jgi:outer membrane protein assembly factor BamB
MMRKVLAGFGLVLILVLSLNAPAPAQTPGTLKWKVYTDNWTTSAAALGKDGTIYVGTGDGVFAFNPASGQKKWSFEPYHCSVWAGPALGPDDTVYAGGTNYSFYALDPVTGQPKWSYETGGDGISPPAIGPDGTVYMGSSNDKKLYAFKSDGSIKWTYPSDEPVSNPTMGIDGTIYFTLLSTSTSPKLVALHPNGTLRWQTQEMYGVSAIGADGTLYGSGPVKKNYDTRQGLVALSPNGVKQWDYFVYPYTPGSLIIGPDGTLYLTATIWDSGTHLPTTKLITLDNSGQLKREPTLGTNLSLGPPALGDEGRLYVGGADGKLYAFNLDGSKAWDLPLVTGGDMGLFNSPLIAPDGSIYIGGSDNYFYAVYSGAKGVAQSPWPTYRRDVRRTACAFLPRSLAGIYSLLLY